MSSQKDPFVRIVGGSGTGADPYVLRSDVFNYIDRIPTGGYHYIPARIAQAREMLANTEMSEETRERLTEKLLHKEWWWHSARAGYLVQLAMQQRLPAQRDDLLRKAREAETAFYEFDKAHADLEVHPPRNSARKSVDELIEMHEQWRRNRKPPLSHAEWRQAQNASRRPE